MKRLTTILLLLAILAPALLVISPVNAAASGVDVLTGPGGPCSKSVPQAQLPQICGDDTTNGNNPIFGSSGIVTVVVRILSLIVGFFAIVFIIFQAIKLSASGGDPQAVAAARGGIIYACIGLLLAVMAQVLVDFVLSRIT